MCTVIRLFKQRCLKIWGCLTYESSNELFNFLHELCKFIHKFKQTCLQIYTTCLNSFKQLVARFICYATPHF